VFGPGDQPIPGARDELFEEVAHIWLLRRLVGRLRRTQVLSDPMKQSLPRVNPTGTGKMIGHVLMVRGTRNLVEGHDRATPESRHDPGQLD